jgi:hypothetical protein
MAHKSNRGIVLLFHDHGTRRGWWASVTSRPLFTSGKDPVPIVQEAGWAPGPVWTGAENLDPTGIRSLNRPARSQSLYHLRYPVHITPTEGFLTLTEGFPCFFLSCKANVKVKLAKTGHGPHSSTLVIICVIRLLFVLFYVLFVCKSVLPPGDNPIAVNKYTISYHIIYMYINSISNTWAPRNLHPFWRPQAVHNAM